METPHTPLGIGRRGVGHIPFARAHALNAAQSAKTQPARQKNDPLDIKQFAHAIGTIRSHTLVQQLVVQSMVVFTCFYLIISRPHHSPRTPWIQKKIMI
eukprot:scaffold30176_cov131-Skeletonema_dohrnii-CCMP3373.AAC.7